MRVLITGGAGFIGSNLADALISAGHDVGIIDNLSTGKRAQVPPAAWFRELDILDDTLPDAMSDFGPDAVVHLAAQASVPVSIKDPQFDWNVNADGTRIVADAAASAGAHRVISASSAAVYGEPSEVPLREDSDTEPEVPYGASKLAAEKLLAAMLAPRGVDYASFRFANVYGPRQDALGEGGVVAIFCHRAAAGETLVVNGDGTQTRDFVYVGDLVGAVMAALASETPLALAEGSAYNISTGVETSVNDLVGALRGACGCELAVENGPEREGDVARSALDPGRAERVFGWSAGTPLPDGLRATWEWFASSR